jgi:hypothetical protein
LAAERHRDTLAQVREHLDEAHAAADRLVREAQTRAEEAAREAAADVPPRGWEAPHGEGTTALPDLAPLLALIEAARRTVPPELTRRLAEALRELLLAVRAVLDWYIERLETPTAEPTAVEDIPID